MLLFLCLYRFLFNILICLQYRDILFVTCLFLLFPMSIPICHLLSPFCHMLIPYCHMLFSSFSYILLEYSISSTFLTSHLYKRGASMKRTGWLFLLIFTLILSSCSSSNEESASDTTKTQDVTITLTQKETCEKLANIICDGDIQALQNEKTFKHRL